jgi:hypothetical protein
LDDPLVDQAGNRGAGEAGTVPTASRLLLPSAGERMKLTREDTSPPLVWKPVRSAGSKDGRGAALALLVILALLGTAFAAPSAFAQFGGVAAPDSGGTPAPDPAPTPAPTAPEPAPAPDSERGEARSSPRTTPQPAETAPDATSGAPETSAPVIAGATETTAPVITGPAESAASEPAAVPRAGQPPRRRAGKRARQNEARDKRGARPQDRRSRVERASPASVFGLNLPLTAAIGRDTGTGAESPPVEVIGWALLALVLAAAALLTLTARLARMEGLTAPMPHDARWLTRILQSARFAPPGTGGRPAS